LKQSLNFQVLWHQVSIDSSKASPNVTQALMYLSNTAAHNFAPVSTMSYTIKPHGDRFEVREEGDLLGSESDAQDVLDVVYRRMYQRSFELASLRGWVRIHAATVELPSGRALLVGRSGMGKTTLSCALRLAGIEVPADESVLVRDGLAIPVPRRFHVKIPVADALPELANIADHSPMLASGAVAAVDPRQLGGGWAIAQRLVQSVYLLERSSKTRLQALAAVETVPQLLDGCFRNQEPTAEVIRAASGIARIATCHRLLVGDPHDAAALLAGQGPAED